MIQVILFILASILLIAVSWRSLRARRSHGFARFFAWEALVGLILLNVPAWFRNPLSPRQLISWLFLGGAIFMVVHGFWLLKQVGKPKKSSTSSPPELAANFEFENTSTLVTSGAYRYIRHPLYSALVLLGLGAYFKELSLFATFLIALELVCLYFTARSEEKENLIRFGESYAGYMKHTRMFIPFIF